MSPRKLTPPAQPSPIAMSRWASLSPADLQAVFPYHTMEAVVRQAERFAVAHCPCRMAAKIRGRGVRAPHRGVPQVRRPGRLPHRARPGSGDHPRRGARHHQAGGRGGAGALRGQRRGPGQAQLQLLRLLLLERGQPSVGARSPGTTSWPPTSCAPPTRTPASAAGPALEICPVQAVVIEDGVAVVDEEWCIGCGVCVPRCPTGAAGLKLRDDIDRVPAPDFRGCTSRS